MIGDALVVLAIGAIAGAIGLALGIVVLTPRLVRWLDRSDEEPRERDD
jgi:hypothetical protein